MQPLLAYYTGLGEHVHIVGFVHTSKPGFTSLQTEVEVRAIIVDKNGQLSHAQLSQLSVIMETENEAA